MNNQLIQKLVNSHLATKAEDQESQAHNNRLNSLINEFNTVPIKHNNHQLILTVYNYNPLTIWATSDSGYTGTFRASLNDPESLTALDKWLDDFVGVSVQMATYTASLQRASSLERLEKQH